MNEFHLESFLIKILTIFASFTLENMNEEKANNASQPQFLKWWFKLKWSSTTLNSISRALDSRDYCELLLQMALLFLLYFTIHRDATVHSVQRSFRFHLGKVAVFNDIMIFNCCSASIDDIYSSYAHKWRGPRFQMHAKDEPNVEYQERCPEHSNVNGRKQLNKIIIVTTENKIEWDKRTIICMQCYYQRCLC